MPDVVVVGAGPAGLALGCYLAREGIDHLIIEWANHPRPHVGESLMPAAVRIFREIGFHKVMEAADFPRSRGITYHPPGRGSQVDIAYREFPQEGVLQDHTYHVDRSKFDLLLMKHAEAMGCRVLQGIPVRRVLFDGEGRACGVTAQLGDQDVDIPARLVVDAAGRGTLIGQQTGLRGASSELDQFGLHAWYVDVDRGKTRTETYTHVHFLSKLRGWTWQAPIGHQITSIGMVADRKDFQDSGLSPEDFFTEVLAGSPSMARAMRKASRINELRGEVNYSYRLERICGDGWLAAGDAAQFIDPVFSSGVCVALHSAKFAAESIVRALRSGDTSRATLLPYEERMFRGGEIWNDFIRTFYKLNPAFIHFVQSSDHRLGILRLLQGDVYDRTEVPVLDDMKRFVRDVEDSRDHPMRSDLRV